jgi:hypothetical protein
MASALHAVGDSEQAEEFLRMGSKLFPDAIHLPMQLAMLLADQGRLPEALDVLDHVSPAPQLPEDMQVFLVGLRANLLATVGRWSEADAVLREGLGVHPDSTLLMEAHDSIGRRWNRRRAEDRLTESWAIALEDLDGVPSEVDAAVVRCGDVLELGDITVLAARRLWRAFLTVDLVRLQSPDPWATALVLAVMELDGRRTSAAASARAMAVHPSTVRSILRRLRSFLDDQDIELARRAFGAFSNPRLDDPPTVLSDSSEVVLFPS